VTGTGLRSGEEHDQRERVRYAWRLLSVVCLASLVTGINVSSLNIALPAVVAGLDAGPLAASWILLSFQLTHVTLMIFFGRLADVLGRRTMYLAGVGVFTAASLLAGAAPTVEVLLAARVAQATGAAMLIANSAALITAAFPRRLLGQGLGIYTASFSLAQMLGPTVGGVVTTELGWRWTLLLNVPFGLVVYGIDGKMAVVWSLVPYIALSAAYLAPSIATTHRLVGLRERAVAGAELVQ